MYKDENQILLDFIISKLIQVSGLEILFIGVSRVRQTNVERGLWTFSNHVTHFTNSACQFPPVDENSCMKIDQSRSNSDR